MGSELRPRSSDGGEKAGQALVAPGLCRMNPCPEKDGETSGPSSGAPLFDGEFARNVVLRPLQLLDLASNVSSACNPPEAAARSIPRLRGIGTPIGGALVIELWVARAAVVQVARTPQVNSLHSVPTGQCIPFSAMAAPSSPASLLRPEYAIPPR